MKHMVVEIDREIPFFPICKDGFGRRCVHNGTVCGCNVYSGDTQFPVKFQTVES